MTQERTDPTLADNGDETHPAFGIISVHRPHASPGAILFQSDLRHSEYMVIAVHEATRKRDLRQDWVHPTKLVCEVSMSMAQFASFVASSGTQGVPCTIEYTGTGSSEPGRRPDLNPAPRLSVTHQEVRKAAAEAYGRIQDGFKAYEAALDATGPGSTAARKAAFRTLRSCIDTAAPNVAYAAQVLDEHAENVVEKSRADVEAMAQVAADRLGITRAQLPAIES